MIKNIVKIMISALLTVGVAYIARPQACPGVNNTINQLYRETSSALGSNNSINEANSTALGAANSVMGKSSIALGANNTVYGKGSVAMGTTNTILSALITAQYPEISAYAIGNNNHSTNRSSFAIGDNNTSNGTFSITIGRYNQSHASTSYAIGFYNTNTNLANGAVAIGQYNTNSTQHCITIGENLSNNTGGIMMGMNSSMPTLYISRSTSSQKTGKVGIGNVTAPEAKLHIKADSGENADFMLEANGSSTIYLRNKNNSISVTGNLMRLNAGGFSYINGNVAIGTMPKDDYKLAVKGVIRSEEVVVELMTNWPDYVFDPDYSLPKLKEVKAFVNENGHLPGLPTASQVSETGLGLGEINTKLLEKIEELTLYIIDQEERIQQLEEKLNVSH